jgi:hypothetical protein
MHGKSLYEGHLRLLCESALGRGICPRPSHSALLQPSEVRVLDTVLGLSEAARDLLSHLLHRKGPWFRVDSMLRYAQDGPWIEGALAELVERHILQPLPSKASTTPLESLSASKALPRELLLGLEALESGAVRAPELQAIAKALHVDASASNPPLVTTSADSVRMDAFDELQQLLGRSAVASGSTITPRAVESLSRSQCIRRHIAKAVVRQRTVLGGYLPLLPALTKALQPVSIKRPTKVSPIQSQARQKRQLIAQGGRGLRDEDDFDLMGESLPSPPENDTSSALAAELLPFALRGAQEQRILRLSEAVKVTLQTVHSLFYSGSVKLSQGDDAAVEAEDDSVCGLGALARMAAWETDPFASGPVPALVVCPGVVSGDSRRAFSSLSPAMMHVFRKADFVPVRCKGVAPQASQPGDTLIARVPSREHQAALEWAKALAQSAASEAAGSLAPFPDSVRSIATQLAAREFPLVSPDQSQLDALAFLVSMQVSEAAPLVITEATVRAAKRPRESDPLAQSSAVQQLCQGCVPAQRLLQSVLHGHELQVLCDPSMSVAAHACRALCGTTTSLPHTTAEDSLFRVCFPLAPRALRMAWRVALALSHQLKWRQTVTLEPRTVGPLVLEPCTTAGAHDACAVLFSSLWEHCAELERLRLYPFSLSFYHWMLSLPLGLRRRGRIWTRVCIDLAHCGAAELALEAAKQGLEDPHVLASDRLDLSRRVGSEGDDDAAVDMPDSPLWAHLSELSSAPVASVTHVVMVRRPLNREVGVKSAFIGLDPVNDDDDDEVSQDESAFHSLVRRCRLRIELGVVVHHWPLFSVPKGEDVAAALAVRAHEAGWCLNLTEWVCHCIGRSTYQSGFASPHGCWLGDVSAQQSAAGKLRMTVEEVVLREYFDKEGWSGIHDEGSVLRSVISLLVWDVVFDDQVPGVFVSPYQDAPSDLYSSPGFHRARAERIKQVLSEVACMSALELIVALRARYSEQHGRACRIMSWGHSLALLQLAAVCLGGSRLAKLADALLFDVRGRSGGLPDLFLWRVLLPETNQPAAPSSSSVASQEDAVVAASPSAGLQLVHGAQYECRFVEVKGPRDRLSDKQRVWMSVVARCGVHVDLCKVEEPGKSAAKRARQAAATAVDE